MTSQQAESYLLLGSSPENGITCAAQCALYQNATSVYLCFIALYLELVFKMLNAVFSPLFQKELEDLSVLQRCLHLGISYDVVDELKEAGFQRKSACLRASL